MRGPVTDLAGRTVAGSELVSVRLRPGIGVQVDGAHLEGGPHALPAHLAYTLVQSQRADVVQPVEGAPSGVEHRDPEPETREGRRGRR